MSDDDEVQEAVMTSDFHDAGIKQLLPRLTKCIAIHGDVCCTSATSESKKKEALQIFS
jgi:hypothetical protein